MPGFPAIHFSPEGRPDMTKRTIAIASDHAGVEMKQQLIDLLKVEGFLPLDLGPSDTASVDYPDYANALCKAMMEKKADAGILTCGSGIGMCIAANRHKGIRAAQCWDGLSARLSRRHNNANVVCIGARLTGIETAKDIVKQFLNTEFEAGRHQRRVEKLG